jgi:hypothetical protein
MPSSTRYNGSTGFGKNSPLGGAGEGAQEGYLICRLGYCRVAQSIGLVNNGPDQVPEPKEVEYLTQRNSTDTAGAYTHLRPEPMAWPSFGASGSGLRAEQREFKLVGKQAKAGVACMREGATAANWVSKHYSMPRLRSREKFWIASMDC